MVNRGVLAQLLSLSRALATARGHRRRLAFLVIVLVGVMCALAYGQIKLNAWNGAFYDLLARRAFADLGTELGIFLLIVGGLLLLVVSQTWLQEMIKVRLREWLTHDLLDIWLAPERPYLLARAGEAGANPDQYVQADARQLAELSASLGFGLLQSTLLLGSFVGVLWVLSGQVAFKLSQESAFHIPAYMVWCALIYALAGSWLAWRVGRPLVHLNAERYAREADLRFAVVRIHESAEPIALHAGEADERRSMDESLGRVVDLGRQLANGLVRLTWVTSGYGWLGLIVPVLVALPSYIFGDLTLGGLMMAVGAFNQVQQALRWFVDNVDRIADWRATLLRVARFREGLLNLDAPGANPKRIRTGPHPDGKLAFANFGLLLPEGLFVLEAPHVEINSGERVVIAGCPEPVRSELLRALAGLEARGTGAILRPPAQAVSVMPRRVYLPFATLRAAVSYPAEPAGFDDAAVCAALKRVGLDRLVVKLDETERWDKRLSADEQQRLALARLLLHVPSWVVFEEATLCGDVKHCCLVRSILTAELAGASVIAIASNPVLKGFYTRMLHCRTHATVAYPPFGQNPRALQRHTDVLSDTRYGTLKTSPHKVMADVPSSASPVGIPVRYPASAASADALYGRHSWWRKSQRVPAH
jgi:putative ATP-binding cassette transporter